MASLSLGEGLSMMCHLFCPFLARFNVSNKCTNRFDCLVNEMLCIQYLKPAQDALKCRFPSLIFFVYVIPNRFFRHQLYGYEPKSCRSEVEPCFVSQYKRNIEKAVRLNCCDAGKLFLFLAQQIHWNWEMIVNLTSLTK